MKRFKYSKSGVILILPILVMTPIASFPDSKGQNAIHNCDEAIAIANAYTGFDTSEGYDSAAVGCERIIGPVNDKTPFLNDKIANRILWKIIYPGVTVGRGSRFAKRDFEVLLDSTTGKLLRIYSLSEVVGSNDTLPEPNAEAAEDYFHNVTFLRIPDSIPPTPFFLALDAIIDNPARVKAIRAMYFDYKVNHPRDTSKGAIYRNNWIIITRGSETIFPSSGKFQPVPDAFLNSHWNVVDGKTGRWIMFTNAPLDKKTSGERGNVPDIGSSDTKPDPRKTQLMSEYDAVHRAVLYTGFGKYKDYSLEKGNILIDTIDAKSADYYLFPDSCSELLYRVTFKAVGAPEDGKRDFDVLIDSESGKLLRIHSLLDKNQKKAIDSLERIERRLKYSNTTGIGFTGLPDSLPEHSFIELLDSTVSDPVILNEIIAYHVYYLGQDNEIKRIWSIDLRGIPPEYSPGPRSAGHFTRQPLSHFRFVWDASTGKRLFGINAP